MKTIITNHQCMQHTITIQNNEVTVFNDHFQQHVSPNIFDTYIVSRNFTGRVNSEEVFKKASRKRTAQGAKFFIGASLCWLPSGFEIQG